MSQIFEIQFLARDPNTFVLRGVISILDFQIKGIFFQQKEHLWNVRHTFVEKQ